ncbi:lymphocyte antigen 96 isoform X1 [Neopsephotus bourkii]|uniref:lymphocyte antigen 96 isoform X1 n=1 Tax=Neopsephotus bourkii TaxID=309878 RepID=UPI002AA59C68|nr:lymphocyte antigen 96 isoform X1 [Neopsephotus bourkii]
MFGLYFFILFTPGVGELLCTSSDLEMSYTFCDSTTHAFMFNLTPCSTMNKSTWNAALTWIPRSDIVFLKIVFNVWYDGAKALHWKEVICSGADDEYSVCGMLKGGECGKQTVPFPCLAGSIRSRAISSQPFSPLSRFLKRPMQTDFSLHNQDLAWLAADFRAGSYLAPESH